MPKYSPDYQTSTHQSATAWELDDLEVFGLIATDRSLVIRFWNKWMVQHSGLSPAEVIGRPLFDVFPYIPEHHLDKLYEFALAGQPTILAQRLHKYLIQLPRQLRQHEKSTPADKYMCQKAAVLPLVRHDEVVGTLTLIDDVTERVLRENELEQTIAAQNALIETTRGILTLDLKECLNRIVKETSALLRAAATAVVLRENDSLTVVACLIDGKSSDIKEPIPVPKLDSPTQLPEGSHIAQWVALSDHMVRLDDLSVSPGRDNIVSFHPQARSVLAAPLQIGGQLQGAIIVESTRPKAYTKNDETLLLGLALNGSVALKNAELYTERAENETRLRTLMDTVPSVIVALDANRRIIEFNPTAESVLGWKREDVLGLDFMRLCIPESLWGAFSSDINLTLTTNTPVRGLEAEVHNVRGARMVVLWNMARCVNPATKQYCIILSGQDITARKQAETERERLIDELRKAMSEIKTLRGFIPICAGCKKIRDDQGYWIQVEQYISSRSDAKFTHGLCPTCAKKYFPDVEITGEPGDAKPEATKSETASE
jgi:PAS domain S-box-containing protein